MVVKTLKVLHPVTLISTPMNPLNLLLPLPPLSLLHPLHLSVWMIHTLMTSLLMLLLQALIRLIAQRILLLAQKQIHANLSIVQHSRQTAERYR